MKYFILFSLLVSMSAWSCDLKLPKHLVIMGDDQNIQHSFSAQGCGTEVLNDLSQFLYQADGRLSPGQLLEVLESKGHLGVKLAPYPIKVEQFKNIVKEQLNLPEGVHIKASRAVNSSPFLALAPGDKITVECQQCLYGSQQSVNVNVAGFDGTFKSFVASVDFKKMVRAFRTTTNFQSFSEVTSNFLKEEYVEMIPQTQLVTDVSVLKYYKTNKPLRNGELLKFSDLNAMNLVKAGLKTEVILENQMVRIRTNGISRGNGTLGEFVEVFHPQKNKKYQGRVVDINKVLVEL